MLAHVGRQLRAAGYDTWIEDGRRSENELLEDAIRFDRIILTCSRKLEGRHGVIRLKSSDKFEWARVLKLNWLMATFTRCLACNTQLVAASQDLLECRTCDRRYWHGSHTIRMRKTLEDLGGVTVSV